MDVYRKTIEEGSFEHQFYGALGFPPLSEEAEDIPLVIRITLGDMELLDGFYMLLPLEASSLSVEDAIRKYVICENEDDRIDMKRQLAKDPNPDLLDIYDDLLQIYREVDAGKISLSYHINNGASDIQPTEPAGIHERLCPIASDSRAAYRMLDIVLEVCEDADPFSGMTEEHRDEMLRDFRSIFVLYLMDKHSYEPMDDRESNSNTEGENLSALLDYLMSEDMLMVSPWSVLTNESHLSEDPPEFCNDGGYSITARGYELLNSIIHEAEFYIDNYDIFGDVYVKGASEISFNTCYGESLIIPVLKKSGVDPFRALFVIALYFGNLDPLESEESLLFSDEPLRDLFYLITYAPAEKDIGSELLDRIISEGTAKVEERHLREARIRHFEDIGRRIDG